MLGWLDQFTLFSQSIWVLIHFPRKSDRKRREKGEGELTTPTLTLFGLWSARKASVTPRIGSLGAGSMLRNHDDMNLAPVTELFRRNRPWTKLRIAMILWLENRGGKYRRTEEESELRTHKTQMKAEQTVSVLSYSNYNNNIQNYCFINHVL